MTGEAHDRSTQHPTQSYLSCHWLRSVAQLALADWLCSAPDDRRVTRRPVIESVPSWRSGASVPDNFARTARLRTHIRWFRPVSSRSRGRGAAPPLASDAIMVGRFPIFPRPGSRATPPAREVQADRFPARRSGTARARVRFFPRVHDRIGPKDPRKRRTSPRSRGLTRAVGLVFAVPTLDLTMAFSSGTLRLCRASPDN